MYEEEISPELKKQYQDAFEMFEKDKNHQWMKSIQ